MLKSIPFIMYIADLCQGFNIALAIFMSLFWTVVLVFGVCIVVNWSESCNGFDETCQKMSKIMKIFIVCSTACTIGFIMCPSKNVVYVYLGTETIESIANNEVLTGEAKEIYKDVKKIIHTYVREEEHKKAVKAEEE